MSHGSPSHDILNSSFFQLKIADRFQEQHCHQTQVSLHDPPHLGWMISLYGCHQMPLGAVESSLKEIIVLQTTRYGLADPIV